MLNSTLADCCERFQVVGAFGLHMVATYERPLQELKNKGSKVVNYIRSKAGRLLVCLLYTSDAADD